MGKLILLDARLFVAGADLSGASNKIEVEASVEDKETTNYRSGGAVERLGGLFEAELTGAGQWEAGDPSLVDDNQWATLMSRAVAPWTLCPTDATVGALAYLTAALESEYKLLDEVGEVAPWEGSAKSSWPMPRGQIAHPPGTARTTSGSGTALQVGTVPAGKHMYAALHVLSASGTTPSLTARVESDDAVGFPSATTRATFTAATARGGQILRVAGPVTDDWWRFAWTISGTTPSFLFAAALGIA